MVKSKKINELRNQISKAVADYQPTLQISNFSEHIELEGCFVLTSPKGAIDTYDVKIQVFPDFPQTEPSVYEIGDRIPKSADYHVNPGTGTCCLGIWEEWILKVPNPSFSKFLKGPLTDYFVSQSWFEIKGEWPYGERAHYSRGLIESYAEILGVPEEFETVKAHLKVLSLPVAKGHLSCPCGSGILLRNCHRSKINLLRERVKPSMAKRMLNRIIVNRI